MSTIKDRIYHEMPHLPYLTCPTTEGHTGITEGMIYSAQERSCHGNFYHKGIDYAREYGAPVYAAAAGYAVAFYHRFPVVNWDRSLRLLNELPLGNGLGYSVQIFHPQKVSGIEVGRITQYGHLSNISSKIQVGITEPFDNDWEALIRKKNFTLRQNKKSEKELSKLISETLSLAEKYPWLKKSYGFRSSTDVNTMESYMLTMSELESLHKIGNPVVHWVEQGEQIGNVGDSALFWGESDYVEGKQLPSDGLKEKTIEKKWDETHLHFEEAQRHPETRSKHRHRDPYGIYKGYSHYTKENFLDVLFTVIKN